MVNSCAAYNCSVRYRKGGVAFHSFPTSQDLRDKWIKALRRSNFTPNQYSKLCANHFTSDCYETAPWSYRKRLKEGAVPTIFEFSQKLKYQKKSLEDSSVQSQDSEDGASEYFVDVPVSRSSNRRKQLIIERKEFNTSDADPHSDKFISKQTELSEDRVETENVAFLPSKRCRKRKMFSSDFVSEDLTSRKGGKGNKCGKNNGKAKDSSVKVVDLNVAKYSEMCILDSLKEPDLRDFVSKDLTSRRGGRGNKSGKNDGKAKDSSVKVVDLDVTKYSEKIDSSEEICISSEIPLDSRRESTNMECRVEGKNILDQEIYGSEGNTLNTMPGKSYLKNNQVECKQIAVRDQETNILVESSFSGEFLIEKIAASSNKALKMGTVRIEDSFKASNGISNVNEKTEAGTELIVAETALQDISCSQGPIAINDAKVDYVQFVEKIDNCNTSSKSVAASSSSTSNQKVFSGFKLNLEEEEAVLLRCKLLGETSKREKPDKEKVIGGNNGESISGKQILKTSSSSENEALENSKRKSYFGDFKQEDLLSPVRAAKCLKVAEKVIREKTMKIKVLKQRERRLMQKVEELENVIFHLVEKRMNPEEASTVLIVLKEND